MHHSGFRTEPTLTLYKLKRLKHILGFLARNFYLVFSDVLSMNKAFSVRTVMRPWPLTCQMGSTKSRSWACRTKRNPRNHLDDLSSDDLHSADASRGSFSPSDDCPISLS